MRWRRRAVTSSPAPERDPCSVRSIAPGVARPAPIGAAPGRLGVRHRCDCGQHIVELCGELSMRTREPLVEALEEALEDDCEQIVLDLSDLDAIDLAGLDTLLVAHMRAGDELKPLVIVPGPPQVQRVLDAAQAPFAYAPARTGPAARSRGRRSRSGSRAGARARPPGARRTR
jgi:anti-anti-sigma factor